MRIAGFSRLWLPIAGLFAALIGYEFYMDANWDNLYWPQSAKDRIEDRAAVIRRIKGPARWCYESRHPENLVAKDPSLQSEVKRCLSEIEPVSAFIEMDSGEYMKRFYRAETERYVCEATLSTVRDDNRVVGSDCYYGLFDRETAPSIGATDDSFG